MEALSFSAKVFLIGVNPYVFLPKHVLSTLLHQFEKSKGTIPVKGKINGKDFTQTLVKYQGAWRLYINGIMRKAAGVDVGDTADIEIMLDLSSREVPMHLLLKEALAENKKAQEAFAKYPPSRKKEINRYLHNIKTQETLTKNIERIVRYLAGEKVGYFVLLRNKEVSN